MKKYGVIIVLVVAVAAAFGAIWHVRTTKETAPTPPPAARQESTPSQPGPPALTTPFFAENGASKTLADFAGKPVLVNFWATWCGPCKQEMPSLDRLAKRMAPEGIAVIALSQDVTGWDKIGPYLAQVKLTSLPVYFDKNGAIARSLQVDALPTTYLLGPDGKPLGRFLGAVDWDSPKADATLRAVAFAKH